MKVMSIVFVLTRSWPFLTLNLLTAVTPCGAKYSSMFSSDSPLRFLSLIIPMEEFKDIGGCYFHWQIKEFITF